MNRDAAAWVSPLVAAAVLAAVVFQTLGALGVTGAFGWRSAGPPAVVSPAYVSLDRALDRRDPSFTLEGLRDPFVFPRPAAPATPSPRPRVQVVPVAPPPPAPLLTAIVWDNDPWALVRWKDREWRVREGGLFDEFQVVKISRDEVTLRRGDSSLVLRRRNPGD